jgi:hypothetical protein
MNRISVSYNLIWEFKLLPYYKWSKCGKLINCRTGRIIKKVLNGSIGYWIAGDFYSLTKLKKEKLVVKITESECPF